ncbi:MAG TPA: VIT and VWA domain-containing protein [Pyrinomonadaceae bacterium]|nr:VIT and VWA domain-containing protein [Pyrinomonadaceae bacterium]
MTQAFFRKSLLIVPTVLVVVLPVLIALLASETTASAQAVETSGALMALDAEGKPRAACPLKQTSVKAEITGFISRVVVTQQFENNFNERIEAVYTFPLPQNAAVDDMTMLVGDRTIRGKILPREEAQAVYEGAKSRGQIASLLDQERPNIFTQSVANILPGDQVRITISYVETLRYEDGAYEFVFPMVVGPRYVPASMSQPDGNNNAPDVSRILPKMAAPGERSGHDISLEVTLDAGLIVESLESKTHPIDIERASPTRARLKLKGGATIPNKDFILRYDIAGRTIQDAVLTHRSDKGGFFTLILQPPDRVGTDDVTPKELIFVLDTSGSMSGFPIEKAKETMKLALDNLYPDDTFNLITFSGDTRILFDQPVRATKRNLRQAQDFLASTTGAGGTEMMSAIKAALEPSDNQSHVRIVCFMTDGFVGNDMQIIAEVRKHNNARVFAFGIGSSVNRFLLDNMAAAGRGDVEYVGLNDDGAEAARRFHQRVRNPLLTDISIDWGDLSIADAYPKRIPDLFGAKPVVVTGRYTLPGSGTIKLKGKMAGSEFTREIPVTLPETMALHDVLAPLWARARIDSLMSEDYLGALRGDMRADLRNTVTQLGMEFRLMTQFTSFVAVEEITVADGGTLRRIDVPVDVPAGMDRNFLLAGVAGGPTALLGSYNQSQVNAGYIAQFNIGRRNQRPPAVTKSGGNVKAAGVAQPTGAGSGGGSAGTVQSPQNLSGFALSAEASGTPGRSALTPEQQKTERLFLKLNPTILMLVYRVQRKETPQLMNYGGFVRSGNAEVQVWLNQKTEGAKAKLKELGFEVVLDAPNSTLIIGRLPIEKLELLADLEFVRYVSPQISR